MSKISNALDIVLKELRSHDESKRIKDRSKIRKVSQRKIDLSHFNLFIKDFQLDPGPHKIEPKELAYLYFKKWNKITDKDKASWFILFREVGKKLTRGRWGRRRYYKTNLKVTDDIKKEAQEYFKEVKKTQTYERGRNAKKVPIYW